LERFHGPDPGAFHVRAAERRVQQKVDARLAPDSLPQDQIPQAAGNAVLPPLVVADAVFQHQLVNDARFIAKGMAARADGRDADLAGGAAAEHGPVA